jgi:hypothetical protein
MAKFGTALGGAFKGLLAEEDDAKDAIDANEAEAVQHEAQKKPRKQTQRS